MKVLAFLVLATSALFVQANIADLINQFGLKDKFKAELPHLIEIGSDIANGKDAKEIVQEALQRHPEVKGALESACKFELITKIDVVKKACDFLTAPQQRGLFGNIAGKFKQEFEHLKEIAAQVTQGKSPVQFIKDLAKKGYAKALTKVCAISFARNIPFVAKACNALDSVGPLPAPVPAPVPEVAPEAPEVAPEVEPEAPEVEPEAPVAQVPHTRGFNFGNILNVVGNLPIVGDQVNKIKQLVDVVKANKNNPPEIAKAVVNLGLLPIIETSCKLPFVSTVPFAGEACGIAATIVPLAQSLTAGK